MAENKPMTKSILLTIKKMLGIAEEYHAFDIDVITNINSVFLTLNQLGVGPALPFSITGEKETWSNFLDAQESYLQGVQTYVYLKVRLLFDPPTNSFLVDAMQKQANEFEWRLMVQPKTEVEKTYEDSFKPDFLVTSSNHASAERIVTNQNGTTENTVVANEESATQPRKAKRKKTNPVTPGDWMDIFS